MGHPSCQLNGWMRGLETSHIQQEKEKAIKATRRPPLPSREPPKHNMMGCESLCERALEGKLTNALTVEAEGVQTNRFYSTSKTVRHKDKRTQREKGKQDDGGGSFSLFSIPFLPLCLITSVSDNSWMSYWWKRDLLVSGSFFLFERPISRRTRTNTAPPCASVEVQMVKR